MNLNLLIRIVENVRNDDMKTIDVKYDIDIKSCKTNPDKLICCPNTIPMLNKKNVLRIEYIIIMNLGDAKRIRMKNEYKYLSCI